MELVSFYISALIALMASLLAVISRNAVHALLMLIVSLLAVACIFYQIGAPLAAALQVIVYAGAILVLMVFVIMMLNQGKAAVDQETQWLARENWLAPASLAGALLVMMLYLLWDSASGGAAARSVSAAEVGLAMYSKYLLVVELASFVLLAGLVGAFHLARRHSVDGAGGRE
ncbi:NADH-quinone oxidoreductase subunit J [Microbulbifer sp. SH-1]|uniref:NADH-quinone oxidoreductase subunit J n=1 Tax=Microbulbifer sp. SH-1 TaxID=2681547 RepID=UPI00140C8B82|nr:NADH-quinone oxidoreductase subunit J [Microbulbifer sp. SH-1]QIL89704.1 NADH-quinone oxidoreductase subunit J [Microbulbifer sp. SH-1]